MKVTKSRLSAAMGISIFKDCSPKHVNWEYAKLKSVGKKCLTSYPSLKKPNYTTWKYKIPVLVCSRTVRFESISPES